MLMKKGFTLIELLIVITIMAILAGAAVPYVQDYVEDARIAKCREDLGELRNAIMRYEVERNKLFALGSKVHPRGIVIFKFIGNGIVKVDLNVCNGANGVILNGRELLITSLIQKDYSYSNLFDCCRDFCALMMNGVKKIPFVGRHRFNARIFFTHIFNARNFILHHFVHCCLYENIEIDFLFLLFFFFYSSFSISIFLSH
jgi:prepilin-type N-terminal cleavage/methylation domain-containing protein